MTKKNWQTSKPTIRERSKHMCNNDLFSDAIFFFDRSFFLSCMYGFEAHISGAHSCSYLKGKGVVVSSEVKFDLRLCSSNNATSIERGQFPEILSTGYYCFLVVDFKLQVTKPKSIKPCK